MRKFTHVLLALVLGAALVTVPNTAAAAQTPQADTRPSAGLVNLNTATAAQLEKLPGIGPKAAARIVDYRLKNGPFKKIEELMNVKGIGEKSFLRLKGQISVATPKPEQS